MRTLYLLLLLSTLSNLTIAVNKFDVKEILSNDIFDYEEIEDNFDFEDILQFILKNIDMEFDDVIPYSHPPYGNYSAPELIEAAGFPSEVHHVTTPDGYILELHRIPAGRDGDTTQPKPIAFVQHCLLCSSADFVQDVPERALAFMLADAGYDVWLNNFRGNEYSRQHTSLDPEKRQFWQFSWDEMAKYDLPSAIDYALNHTGQTQVYYAGFSMGTTTFMALLSERPDYINEKVKASALMGPAVYMDDVKGPLHKVANYSDRLDTILGLLGFNEIPSGGNRFDELVQVLCDEEAPTASICYQVLFLIGGPDPEELNKHNLPVYLAHTPAGTSLHTVNHYGQEVLTGDFQKYDYGLVGNNNNYGQKTPPLYNISQTSPPIALYWGKNDWLATPENVVRMVGDMKNVVVNHEVEWEEWNHLDFIWGIHAKEYVYDHVLEFLSRY